MWRNNFIAYSHEALDYSEDNNISSNAFNTMMNPDSIQECIYQHPQYWKEKTKYNSHNHAKN